MRKCCFLLFLCSVTTSCLKDIDLDTGERILNVYCILKQGPKQELELSYIAPTGGTSSPVREEVTITLHDEDSSVGQFTRVSETKWNLDFSPEGGHTYILKVAVSGQDMLMAETRFPIACTLQYVWVREGYIRQHDPSDRMMYDLHGYELESSEDQILWCFIENLDRTSGAFVDKEYIWKYIEDQGVGSNSFAEFIVTDHPGVDYRGESIYPCDWPILIGTMGFDKNRWSFSGRVFSAEFYGEPALYHEKVVRILHPAGFSRTLDNDKLRVYRTPGRGFPVSHPDNEEEYEKTSMFCLAGMNRTTIIGDLVINSVSTEYDKYLSEFYYRNRDTGDFTQYVYKRNFYSNVMNGTGIFGAAIEYRPETSWLFPLLSDRIPEE